MLFVIGCLLLALYPMEAIEGNRRGSTLFKYDGHLYRKDYERQGKRGYRCTDKGCKGRLLQRADGDIVVTTGHSHGSKQLAVDVLALKNRMKRRAAESGERLREIFDEETRNSNVADEVGFAELESCLYKQRRRVLPQLPREAADAFEAIKQAPDRFKHCKDVLVLQGEARSRDGGIAIAFAHPEMLQRLSTSTIWCMDGTFRTVPSIFSQLLTIGFIQFDIFWPAVYLLLNRKTQELYKRALSYLAGSLCPLSSVCTIITDFELPLMTAERIS
jgi:hypothetical protein